MKEVTMEVWGEFACFSQPAGKVERLTYPFPTPSAARGIFSAVYMKPKEFVWEIRRIEVLNPIRYISFKRNEVQKVIGTGLSPIITDEVRTQRQTVALKDVRYRVTAVIMPQPGFEKSETQIYEQAVRRIQSGKAFMQPCFGLREFAAYFEQSDGTRQPIEEDLDAGLMLYDVFDLYDCEVRKKPVPRLSLFHAYMKRGVIEVPPYHSESVIKAGGIIC